MTTENSNLAAPVESVGIAEDVQNVTSVESVAAEKVVDADPQTQPDVEVDFADEDAALDAQRAGLSLGEETAEEQAAEDVDRQDLGGMSKEQLVEMFASQLATEPVHTLRKSVEAIKIAFYKQHRAEIDAARKAFEAEAEEGAEFVVAPDASEARLKDLFKEYRQRRDEYIANLDREKEANLKIKLAIIDELKELVNSD